MARRRTRAAAQAPDLLVPAEARAREKALRAYRIAPHGKRRQRRMELQAATTACLKAKL